MECVLKRSAPWVSAVVPRLGGALVPVPTLGRGHLCIRRPQTCAGNPISSRPSAPSVALQHPVALGHAVGPVAPSGPWWHLVALWHPPRDPATPSGTATLGGPMATCGTQWPCGTQWLGGPMATFGTTAPSDIWWPCDTQQHDVTQWHWGSWWPCGTQRHHMAPDGTQQHSMASSGPVAPCVTLWHPVAL